MEENELYKLYKEAIEYMNKMEYESALNVAEKIENLKKHTPNNYAICSGLYIDLGLYERSIDTIEHGVELLESHLDQFVSNEKSAQATYYNLANGYSNIFKLKKIENRFYGIFEETELNIALDYYFKALQAKQIDEHNPLQILVNIGNTLDQMGRSLEAIEYYNKVLNRNNKFGMALGNKGITLKHYSRIVREKWPIYYSESYFLLKKALKCDDVYNDARVKFENHIKEIEKNANINKLEEISNNRENVEIETDSEFEEFLIQFCLENNLYLNLCNLCQSCKKAIGDNIAIKKMIVETDDEGKPGIEDDPFLKVSSFLNEIKQNYVTARFLLIQSRYPKSNLDFVDKNVKIIDTLDYKVQNVYVQLLKFAFKNMYDILDKIAIFINEYLNLGKNQRYISFSNIWKENVEINSKIKETKNYNLNALYQINKELGDGRFKELRNIRNAVTHRFMDVNIFRGKKMDEKLLVEKTIEMSQLVKRAIIYLISFVDVEERKMEEKIEDPLVAMNVFEVPDDIKS